METLDRAKVYSKVKKSIIPFAFLIYFFNAMDRANISFAALTMNKELNITAVTFGVISSAFFISYTICQIPANMLLKKIGARAMIPTIACLWGLITFLTFFARNATQIIVLRILLGIVEAGFFPGMMYWFTLWFPSRERGSVTSLFMLSATVANIVGSPLAGLIVQYANWLGFSGWRWLFVFEGLPPAIIALFGYSIMRNSPEDVKWLSDDEKTMIHSDLEEERKLTTTVSHKVGVARILTNGMLWKLAMIYMTVQIATQTSQLWLPTLFKNFTHDMPSSVIGYIFIIPAVTSAISMYLFGKHSDKTGERKWHAVIPMLLMAASFFLILLPIGGLPYKIVMLAVYGLGYLSWDGAYWTMPSGFLSPEILAVAMAFINTCSSIGGYIGNQMSGVIDAAIGDVGVFVFLGTMVLISAALILTLDFSQMKIDHIHDQSKADEPAKAVAH